MIPKKVSNIKKKVFVQDLLNYFQFLVKKRRMKMFMKQTQQESLKICFKDITHIIQLGVQMFKYLQSKSLQIFNNTQIVYYLSQGLKLQGNQKSTIYQYHNQQTLKNNVHNVISKNPHKQFNVKIANSNPLSPNRFSNIFRRQAIQNQKKQQKTLGNKPIY